MKKFLMSKKGLVLLVTMIAAVAMTVGAYAYFTSNGTGVQQNAGLVGSATPNNWTIATQNGGTTYNQGTALYPTDTASANASIATVPFTVTNNDEASELLTSYTAMIDPTWAAAHPTCLPAWFKIGSAATGSSYTNSSLHVLLSPNSDGDAGGAVYHGTVALELVAFDTIQDGCQTLTPQLKITATS
jgi:hypothetical protein